MKGGPLRVLVFFGTLLYALPSIATNTFSFAVIPRPLQSAQATLRAAIRETDDENLAFVVANGIKAADEPCSDMLYGERRTLLQNAKNGLMVSLAASDWTGCKDENGGSDAIERLSRLRELFFPEDFSFGASRIPLVRQSAIPRFRAYMENAHWEIGGVMFATIDLPDDNNHYLFEAGRNSEFEDRVIANRSWLHRLFTYAKYQKLRGIVLFSDADPLTINRSRHLRRDGLLEVRRQLIRLSAKFSGPVLIVHNAAGPQRHSPHSAIVWHGRLGELTATAPWTRVTVNRGQSTLFAVTPNPTPPEASSY